MPGEEERTEQLGRTLHMGAVVEEEVMSAGQGNHRRRRHADVFPTGTEKAQDSLCNGMTEEPRSIQLGAVLTFPRSLQKESFRVNTRPQARTRQRSCRRYGCRLSTSIGPIDSHDRWSARRLLSSAVLDDGRRSKGFVCLR